VLQGGRVAGDTTDGCGLVTDLTGQHAIALSGMRILLLGAGGAASGVVEPLLAGQPALLHIANRTPGRAAELVERFSVLGPVTGGGYESVDGRFDLLINATSASLGQALPPLKSDWITPETLCYDMMYGIEPTPFMRWASENGAKRAVDGLGMLVGQAAESFAIWRGVRPDVGPVVSALRSIMIDG
jgi:shikimate dehydrogenase